MRRKSDEKGDRDDLHMVSPVSTESGTRTRSRGLSARALLFLALLLLGAVFLSPVRANSPSEAGSLHGYAVTASGEPIPFAYVTVRQAGNPIPAAYTFADMDGRYILPAIISEDDTYTIHYQALDADTLELLKARSDHPVFRAYRSAQAKQAGADPRRSVLGAFDSTTADRGQVIPNIPKANPVDEGSLDLSSQIPAWVYPVLAALGIMFIIVSATVVVSYKTLHKRK